MAAPNKEQKVKGFGTNQIEEDIRDRVGTIQDARQARSSRQFGR